ncbi:MAG TPA: flavin reductase family protein [Anaerolineae bacterium]|nr:flavin reductase family protein [Anaerolineae bacterium]
MSITSEAFRQAMRHFPAGVTIVTIKAGEQRHGLTVSAFVSISPEPPLIMVAIDERHHAYELLEQEGAVFAVNILHQEQTDLSNRFAWIKDEDRFAQGSWGTAVTGAPILEDALSWLDCTIYDRFKAGTHMLYLGEVQASAVLQEEKPPLIYWHQGYRQLKLKDGE